MKGDNLIGRYQVIREIGRGGMATVYLAKDHRVGGRNVAVKVLPPDKMLHIGQRERFEREAWSIAALEHPAIVPIYDFGEHEGYLYLVMRYMSGGGLDTLNDRHGRLSLRYVLRILQRIGSALDVAHDHGIVHRDVKPSNILLDQYEDPFLCDFGIVKMVDPDEAGQVSTTMIGTPSYMSPEQIRGDSVTGRSDIYGLGTVLFELLALRPPFPGKTTTDVLHQHLHMPVPRLNDIQASVPVTCQAVVERAMAKHPEQRYETATAMATAFELAIDGYDSNAETVRLGDPEQLGNADLREPHDPRELSSNSQSAKENQDPAPLVGWRPLEISKGSRQKFEGQLPFDKDS